MNASDIELVGVKLDNDSFMARPSRLLLCLDRRLGTEHRTIFRNENINIIGNEIRLVGLE